MLSFAVPGFAALLLAAGLVWYLHSRRERRQVVGSLRLWRQVEVRSGRQPQARLVPPLTLPLILQLLAVALFALALAQPFWGGERVPDHLVVVVDTAASMQAEQQGESLLDQAREQVAGLIGGRDRVGPQRVSVLTAGVTPRFEAARWPWRDDTIEGPLSRIAASDGPSDWAAAARLLDSVLREDEDTRIVWLSDAAPPAVVRQAAGGHPLTEIVLSASGPDAGLSARMTEVDAAAAIWRIEGEIIFRGELDAVEVVVLYASEMQRTPLEWARIEVARDDEAPARVAFAEELELPGPGIVTARIGGDISPRDNVARFVLPDAPASMEVLYIGDGEQPLLRALNAVEGVVVYQDDRLTEAADAFDLVIIDRIEVSDMPRTNTLVIVGEDEERLLDDPDPDGWNDTHPLARDIDWAGLVVERAVALPETAEATRLLEADGAVLIDARTTPQGRLLRLGFDPSASNWPDQASFPLFVSNLIDWLGQQPGLLPEPACRVGLYCVLDARLADAPISNLDAPGEGPARVPRGAFVPEQAGLFMVGLGAQTQLLAVNPSVPPTEDAREEADVLAAQAGLPQGWAFWFLGLGIVVLAVEGVVAVRRRGGVPQVSPLRLGAIGLGIVALVNLPLPMPQPREALVLIVPSALEGETEAAELAFEANPLLRPSTGTVRSGPRSAVVADLTSMGNGLSAPGGGRISHVDTALALAAALVPEGRQGRLVLGADLVAAPADVVALIERGITVDYLAPAAASEGIVVSRLDAPRQVFAGDSVPLTGLIHTAETATVDLEIVENGEVVAAQEVALSSGHNRVEAVLPSVRTGDSLVEMRLAASDGFPAHREGRIVSAQDTRPVAVIAADPAHAEAFTALLQLQGLEAEAILPRRAPHYIEDWLDYGGAVLINTPALALSTLQQQLLETAVAQHGMGLLILGGPDSFGPGGYFGTPIEQLSPLSSRVPQDAPEVAMVFVLDRSGSMRQAVGEGNRLDIAKRATLSAMELLNPQSQVGIVVFDDRPSVILPLTQLEDNLDTATAALEGIDPGGGTAIYPGLVEAFEMMRDVDAPARHVVVMTDGLSQPGDFERVLTAMRAEGITVSAVAIGRGADATAVNLIAEFGGGSAHATDDFEALPSILSQEAMLLASPIEEGVTQPRWVSRSAAFLGGLPDRLPPLGGFVLTTAKPEAELVMVAQDSEQRDMPVMAWWRYGNGMVLALSTDATGPWSEAWQRLPQYGALWEDMLRQFQPATPRPGLTLSTFGDGEYLTVSVSALDPQGLPQSGRALVAAVSAPGQEAAEMLALSEERPGLYAARSVLDATGLYTVSVDASPDDPTVEAAYYHAYPAQYDLARAGGAAMLAAATGGQEREVEELAAISAGLSWAFVRAWPVWALLAFALFLFDLIVRYRGLFRNRDAGVRRAPQPAQPQGNS